jgi:uncharacterized membrane protein YkoI
MRGVLRSILIVMFAAMSVLTATAAPRDRAPHADRKAVVSEGSVTTADNDRWRGGRFGWRRGERDHDRARDGVISGRLLPLEAVLAHVARQYPGHHIGVDGPYQQGGRWVYRIKWLTPEGRVIFIFADAETGQILGQRGG